MVVALVACGRQNFAEHDAPVVDTTIDNVPGLLVWYRMEDDLGDGVLADASGNARVARCIVGISCPTPVAGARGNAIAFNGMQSLRVTYGEWLATPTAVRQ